MKLRKGIEDRKPVWEFGCERVGGLGIFVVFILSSPKYSRKNTFCTYPTYSPGVSYPSYPKQTNNQTKPPKELNVRVVSELYYSLI